MAFELIDKHKEGEWNRILAELPGAHILQTSEWAEVKCAFGWDRFPLVWRGQDGNVEAAAMVLRRSLSLRGIPLSLCVLYVPRGPVMDWNNRPLRRQVLEDLKTMAKRLKAMFIKIDPEVITGYGEPGKPGVTKQETGQTMIEELKNSGWQFSSEQIQFPNTVHIALDREEEELLARMKQKTRYNIRLAQKKGVTVRLGTESDLPGLYRMYAETSQRDGFIIRSWEYYRAVWEEFYQKGMMEILIAEAEGNALGGLLLFTFAGRSWYLYGMSNQEQREKMPNYLLQWTAIQRAKEKGCTIYDLWGAPTVFHPDDGLWNVFRFKEGFAGEIVRTIGAWDYPNQKWIYPVYMKILPSLLDIMRRRGREKTRQEAAL